MDWMYDALVWQDAKLTKPWRRMNMTARHHSPLVVFLLFASFILLCMHLPWSGTWATTGYFSRYSSADRAANKTMPLGNGTLTIRPNATMRETKGRFAKITVASGFEDILYEKALQTHIDHALKWGYPLYMARRDVEQGRIHDDSTLERAV